MIGQATHVLQTITLLDEADDVLNPPAGGVGLDDMPNRLPAPADREVREDHQRLFAEAYGHDQRKFFLPVGIADILLKNLKLAENGPN